MLYKIPEYFFLTQEKGEQDYRWLFFLPLSARVVVVLVVIATSDMKGMVEQLGSMAMEVSMDRENRSM